jgi:hypothetical protein
MTDGAQPISIIQLGRHRPSATFSTDYFFRQNIGDNPDYRWQGTSRFMRWSERGRVAASGLPESSQLGIEQFAANSSPCRTRCTIPIPGYNSDNNVIILTGFEFSTLGTFRNLIDTIGLRPFDDNLMEATLSGNFERFSVNFSYVLFPKTWAGAEVISSGRSNDGPTNIHRINNIWTRDDLVPLLQGFWFSFTTGPNRVLEISVDNDNTRTVTTFDNGGGHEQRQWILWAGLCRPRRVVALNAFVSDCGD